MIISNTSELLEWNIFTDGWATEWSLLISFSSYNISTVWLNWFSEIIIWLNFSCIWLTVNASGCVPWVITLNILDSMNKVSSSISLTLSQILRLTKEVLSNSSMVFNSFLYNCCFWELVFIPLCMKGHSSTIFNSLLTISKYMGIWVEFPLIVSVFLFTWLKVTMGLLIHFLDSSIIILHSTSYWVDHIFGALKASWWHTKFHFTIFGLGWPFVLSWVASS